MLSFKFSQSDREQEEQKMRKLFELVAKNDIILLHTKTHLCVDEAVQKKTKIPFND